MTLIAFWYETETINDPKKLGPLSLAFDKIICPDDYASKASLLISSHEELPILRYPTRAITNSSLPFCSISECRKWDKATEETSKNDAGYDAWEIDSERYKFSIIGFNKYVELSSLNNGCLIGESEIANYEYNTNKKERFENTTNLLVGLLAISGVKVALPKVGSFQEEDILKIKEKYNSEREGYQYYIKELISGGYDLIKADPTIEELQRWAYFQAETKIAPSLHKLMHAIQCENDKKLLDRITTGFANNFPTLIGSAASPDQGGMWDKALIASLEIFAPKLTKSIIERRILGRTLGLGYLYHIQNVEQSV